MTSNELFQAALQLKGSPWRVVRSDFSGEPPTLEIGLDFAGGGRFRCPQCAELCGVYDTVQKRWRHLNFFNTIASLSPQCRACAARCTEFIWYRSPGPVKAV